MRTRMIVRRPSCHSMIYVNHSSDLSDNQIWWSTRVIKSKNLCTIETPSWQMIIDYFTDFTLWFSSPFFYCKSMLRLWHTTMTFVRRFLNRKCQLKLLYDPYFQSSQTENRNIKIRNYSLTVWSCSRHVIKNLTYRELIRNTLSSTRFRWLRSLSVSFNITCTQKNQVSSRSYRSNARRHISHTDTFLDVYSKSSPKSWGWIQLHFLIFSRLQYSTVRNRTWNSVLVSIIFRTFSLLMCQRTQELHFDFTWLFIVGVVLTGRRNHRDIMIHDDHTSFIVSTARTTTK